MFAHYIQNIYDEIKIFQHIVNIHWNWTQLQTHKEFQNKNESRITKQWLFTNNSTTRRPSYFLVAVKLRIAQQNFPCVNKECFHGKFSTNWGALHTKSLSSNPSVSCDFTYQGFSVGNRCCLDNFNAVPIENEDFISLMLGNSCVNYF